jgi:hypothetical protein
MASFLKGITAGVCATLLWAGTANAAALLGQEPAPSLIVRTGNFEWVYASPCGGGPDSCSPLLRHHRFDFATDTQWTTSFANLDALIAAFTVNGEARCASTYFSVNYDHCDFTDLTIGAIWNSPFGNGVNESAAETFLVRTVATGEVPEPASLALIALGLAAVAARRRKHN